MNYLSHHLIARQRDAGTSPWFYAGNLLPDLLPSSGDGRVRSKDVATLPDDAADAALVQGARLHLDADRRFHGNPAFTQACAEASARLREAPFDAPPRRVFFLAHALVEIALDGWVIQTALEVADDLYRQLETVGAAKLTASAERLVGRPLPLFTSATERFLASRFLLSYATFDGCAVSLRNLCRRADIPNFENRADLARLADVFTGFQGYVRNNATALLDVGSPVVK